MYKKVNSDLKVTEREEIIREYWKENNIFEESIKSREGHPFFTFFDGPPTANGKPHIGHVITRAMKDLFPRYKTMKGYKVLRKAGWDTHGLPVELEVEKLLGFSGKEQIEKYGIAPFIDKCKESVFKYESMWEEFSEKVGFWADMENPYVTFHNDYIESVWWALKKIFDQGLLYKGHKIVPYCPRCGTPLASHEVAQGYEDVKERTVFVKFKIKDSDTFFMAWTTTPWTLPSNVALAVNPTLEYVKVLVEGEKYIIAKGQIPYVFKDKEVEVLETYLGKDLEYTEYEPLYYFKKLDKKAHFVTLADYVALGEGTGIVHIAPAFGQDDYLVGRRYNLPFVQYVNNKGEMTEDTIWPNTFVKDADPMIIDDLKERGLLYRTQMHVHSYPFCWRCHTPLIYYGRDSWFIETTKIKDKLIENNKHINWIPETIGTGRFGDWLNNVQDWVISRNRYWGTPLPIWVNDKTGELYCIGSVKELHDLTGCDMNIELHRPYIDNLTWEDKVNGGVFRRVEEVIDCWFDSGSMPFAQWHYPFENKELFDNQFPADFISEAVDQTRGWFYSLLAISTLLFDEEAFKNCIVLGLVLDENGQKMSKSKGNAVDPMTVLNKFGADATRWFFYETSQPWVSKNISDAAILEGQKKYLNTLYNTYSFYVLYANIDNFDATKYSYDYDKLSLMDKWLLSKLNTLIKEVDERLDRYEVAEPARLIETFVDELSNWYVRRSRSRFWAKGMEQDKIDAYLVLYETLVKLSKLIAPFSPFIADEIYQNLVLSLNDKELKSVHLCDYPVSNPLHIDKELEKNMDEVLQIVVLGRAIRAQKTLKNRQPLSKMYVVGGKALNDYYAKVIEDELNVHEVLYSEDLDDFTSHRIKPNLKVLGPKLGKTLGEIRSTLESMDQNAAYKTLKSNGYLDILDLRLEEADLLVETLESDEFASMSNQKLAVVLDTNLTEELINEGYVRDVVSKVQSLRKEAGFEVIDHITLSFKCSDTLANILKNNEESIASVTLADKVVYGETLGYTSSIEVNDETLYIGVLK